MFDNNMYFHCSENYLFQCDQIQDWELILYSTHTTKKWIISWSFM